MIMGGNSSSAINTGKRSTWPGWISFMKIVNGNVIDVVVAGKVWPMVLLVHNAKVTEQLRKAPAEQGGFWSDGLKKT